VRFLPLVLSSFVQQQRQGRFVRWLVGYSIVQWLLKEEEELVFSCCCCLLVI
jgi:hypothetical protein